MRRAVGVAFGASAVAETGADATDGADAAVAAAAAGAATAVLLPLPLPATPLSSITASSSPIFTSSPDCRLMLTMTPARSALTSRSIFSVSSSTTGSPTSTRSPTFFSHRATRASTTDSPSCGTTMSDISVTDLEWDGSFSVIDDVEGHRQPQPRTFQRHGPVGEVRRHQYQRTLD